MKKSKHIAVLIVLGVLLAFVSSCRKYPDFDWLASESPVSSETAISDTTQTTLPMPQEDFALPSVFELDEKYGNARLGCTDEKYEYKKTFCKTYRDKGGNVIYLDSLMRRERGTFDPYSAVCGDPVCKHTDASCPFFGILSFSVYGSTILYTTEIRGAEGHAGYSFCTYDMKSAKKEVRCTSTDERLTVRTFDDGVFYLSREVRSELKTVETFFRIDSGSFLPSERVSYENDMSKKVQEIILLIYRDEVVISVMDIGNIHNARCLVVRNLKTGKELTYCKDTYIPIGFLQGRRYLSDGHIFWQPMTNELLDLDTFEITTFETDRRLLGVTDRCRIFYKFGDYVEGAVPGALDAGNGRPMTVIFERLEDGAQESYTVNQSGFFVLMTDIEYYDGTLNFTEQQYTDNRGNIARMKDTQINVFTSKWRFFADDGKTIVLPEELTGYPSDKLY